jgi:hypothetical protein
MATDVASSLATFNNTKLYIHSQKEEFFRRGVNVRSNATTDEIKSEDAQTTRMDTINNDVNPLDLDADIAHFKVYSSDSFY